MFRRRASAFLLLAALSPVLTYAQSVTKRALVTQPVEESKLTVLRGNTYPLAVAKYDRGAAPGSLPMQRMLLVLKRPPELETALDTLLDQQQDKSSPNYHAWLTPQQFGQQFGPADADIQAITSWLELQGFQIAHVSNGRTVIEFSGTAAQVQSAFHTEIHKYTVDGADHWANATDPQIPSALVPAVAGVLTLHNFQKKSQLIKSAGEFTAKYAPGSRPQFTASNGLHALAPADFSLIYNATPVYGTGINGAGEAIAVVGRTNININDVIEFRNVFGLPTNNPQIIVNGQDPGDLGGGEEAEAVLDTSWSGAAAPGARVLLIVSGTTNATDGVTLSEEFIVDNDLGDVMTESFGSCEFGVGTAEESATLALAEQAAAQGITYVVSTGDSGAEGCDNPNQEEKAIGPVSVNVLASTPFTIGIGGTAFNENGHTSTYWNSTNDPTTLASVKSYIPENVWNESCATNCGTAGPSIWAGSGGASTLVTKPSWQSAVAGIPADNARDLPDVSLSAAGHDPYLICLQNSCVNVGGFISFAGISGTSASAPSFAGIMALVDQKTGSRQGQANYVLYRLAAQETYSGCNGSSTTVALGTTCIFNDTTVGNNAVPGEGGFGTPTAQYQSGVGYDLATGLGSVNVANLVNGWGNARSSAANISLALNPATTGVHGSSISVTSTVTPAMGTGTPTGDISLYALTGENDREFVDSFTLAAGAISSSTKQLPGGTYYAQAHYAGDGTFTPADSDPILITVLPETTTTVASIASGTSSNLSPFASGPYGTPIFLQSTVTGGSGVGTPTGQVNFVDSLGTFLQPGFVNAAGLFTVGPISTYVLGTHSVTGTYSGDLSFKTSVSAAVHFTITQAPTSTSIQAPAVPFIASSPQPVVVIITTTGMGNAPTGTVTLLNGATPIGSPVSVVPTNGNFAGASAHFTVTLPPGPATLSATYNGDMNYLASTSAPINVTAIRAAMMAVTSSNLTVPRGTSVTFTATLTPAQPGGPNVTGTVQFTSNLVTSTLCTVTVSNDQAQCTTDILPVGLQDIFTTYSGDANYAATNAEIQEQITPGPDFSIVASPPAITINAPGQSGSTMLMLTAMNGLTGTFNLAPQCTGFPSETSCSVSPSSVTFSSTVTTASVMLTVSTTAPSSVVTGRWWEPTGIGTGILTAFSLAALALLLGFVRKRRRFEFALGVIAVAALLTFASCGGGGGGGGGGGVHNPGTPVGLDQNARVSFTLGSASHTVAVSINVE